MSNRVFQAGNWFNGNFSNSLNNHSSQEVVTTRLPKNILPPFDPTEDQSTSVSMSKFFVPGWKGESLLSKEVQKFNKLVSEVHADTKRNFLSLNHLNRKLIQQIFNEFFSFLEFKAMACNDLDDFQKFWLEIKNEESEYREILDHFIDIYTYRVAVIYILKIRFISGLLKHVGQPFDLKCAFYPNSLITTLFRKGSKNELKAKSLESNIYSWYKPSDYATSSISKLISLIGDLNITELVKNLSLKSEHLIKENAEYSHTLSHKNFGLFLNSLLINFPLWLSSIDNKSSSPFKVENTDLEVISCKYTGDYLESTALSHWLAQENNKQIKWQQILCPDFKNYDFDKGSFLKICSELQFLTFLTQLAGHQGSSVISFVSQVMSAHVQNKKESSHAQKFLLMEDFEVNSSTYDRIFINISNYPKNNIQHYLINQISLQEESLKDSGFVYVLSSKKLFVPSQKSKLEAFLEKFKLEAIINLEELKGKGEVGNFLYILKKKQLNPWSKTENKQNCFSFRFSGELETFQNFKDITSQLSTFFNGHMGETVPMYQKETALGHRMEFFQDAVVDGRLIHSSSKDSNKITHPHFFNNLMKACNSFDYYFDISNIDLDNKFDNSIDENDFFIGDRIRSRSPYIIVVDHRNKKVSLEIIHEHTLEATVYEYGRTQCSYFGISPKWPNLNLNAVQDFFKTKIGAQIIDLTFNNEHRKVKANLTKMLLPKFLVQNEDIPEHIAKGLSILSLNAEQITGQHPNLLKKNFNMIEILTNELSKNYPAAIFSSISTFKKELKNCIDRFELKNNSVVNFANPILKGPLVKSRTRPIYPKNPDIYVEFCNLSNASFLHLPLDKAIRKNKIEEGITTYELELYAQGEKVLSLYSDEGMIQFLEFIFSKAINVPVSKILQGVAVPYLEDLKTIISSYTMLQKTLCEIYQQIDPILENLINKLICYRPEDDL